MRTNHKKRMVFTGGIFLLFFQISLYGCIAKEQDRGNKGALEARSNLDQRGHLVKNEGTKGKQKLPTPPSPELVRKVTKSNATEPPFRNAYWNNKLPGLYVDPYDGNVLFASIHKYKSGTGWPSFYKTIDGRSVEEVSDRSFGMTRIEVRSSSSDSHLGHLFDDGPAINGKRYCINSAALKFIPLEPVEEFRREGYGDYLALFAENPQKLTQNNPELASAFLAGGCFWCTESAFEGLDGVMKVISGYTVGKTENPGYKEVSNGESGHFEAVQILYNPKVINYQRILEIFWRQIDPTDAGGQFFDRGSQYHTAIFYRNEEERQIAEQSKAELIKQKTFGDKPIATKILPEAEFYLAEEYHQDYYLKNPLRYKAYAKGSGREYFFQKVWNERKE